MSGVSATHLLEIAAGRSHAFPQAFRLKRQRLIRPLFDRRRDDTHTLGVGCVRLVFRVVPPAEMGQAVPVQVGFAPGREGRGAVGRNRLRRLMREVYRTHQHGLVDLFLHRSDALTLMVLFRGRPEQAAVCIPRDLPRALAQLCRFDFPQIVLSGG